MDITGKLLCDNGFELDQRMLSSGVIEYKKEVPHKNGRHKYHLTVWGESNTSYRDWSIQVDNETHMTCGGIDLQTVEHFNTFMDLLDLDFKL
jgi:hypothetical protein